MNAFDNEHNRFGSARFASRAEIAAAGLFRQTPTSLFMGFWGGKPLWYSSPGGAVLTAGARAGKLAQILGYNLCCKILPKVSLLVLDPKGECAAISQDQTPDKKHCLYWNPAGLHGLNRNRVNPTDYMTIDSPSLVSDGLVLAENLIPLSGAAQGEYFEMRAREYLLAIMLTLVQIHGVLRLPDLYEAISLIPGGGDAWLDFGYEMLTSQFPLAHKVEQEIAASREDTTGGFRGILGELSKAVSCLADPDLRASVSPPYDFSLRQLTEAERFYQIYLMPPAEFITPWAPVMKAMLVGAMLYKSRAPQAPRQMWLLDEAGQIGRFPLVVKLYTYGAGIGITPLCVFQSSDQMDLLGPKARSIITSSAALQIFFTLREMHSASGVSAMLGMQTLEYDDRIKQGEAEARRQTLMQGLLGGEDPFAIAHHTRHLTEASGHRSKQRRPLLTPDEVLNAPPNAAFIFVDGVQHPIIAERRNYWEQRFMAGRYHPNPFHPPLHKVRIQTRWGRRWGKVVRRRVPRKFAHLPQYADGTWSQIWR